MRAGAGVSIVLISGWSESLTLLALGPLVTLLVTGLVLGCLRLVMVRLVWTLLGLSVPLLLLLLLLQELLLLETLFLLLLVLEELPELLLVELL